jgi:hypothetical protein
LFIGGIEKLTPETVVRHLGDDEFGAERFPVKGRSRRQLFGLGVELQLDVSRLQ